MPFPWIQLTFLVVTFLVNAFDPSGWKSSVNSKLLPCIWKLWFTLQVGKGLLHTSVCCTTFWPFMHITGLPCSWKCCVVKSGAVEVGFFFGCFSCICFWNLCSLLGTRCNTEQRWQNTSGWKVARYRDWNIYPYDLKMCFVFFCWW